MSDDAELFICYSHKDEKWKNIITTFLRVIERTENVIKNMIETASMAWYFLPLTFENGNNVQ